MGSTRSIPFHLPLQRSIANAKIAKSVYLKTNGRVKQTLSKAFQIKGNVKIQTLTDSNIFITWLQHPFANICYMIFLKPEWFLKLEFLLVWYVSHVTGRHLHAL